MTDTDDWRAACRGRTDAMFIAVFAPIARKLCAGCPVLSECLTDALATEPWEGRHGIRAGMDPGEFYCYRKATRRNRRPAA